MHSTEFTGPARYATLPSLLAWLGEQTRAAGLDALQAKRLELVVEELFANTVEHGFRGESEQPVTVGLAVATEALILCYSDGAPPFDPTACSGNARDEDSLGGFGLGLVRAFASRIRYKYVANRNVMELEFGVGDPRPNPEAF